MNRHAAILTSLSLSQWTGRKLDRKTSLEVTRDRGADRSAGRWIKCLLPGEKSLAAIAALAGELRQLQHTYTLPWRDDGWRLLPSSQYLEHTGRVRDWKRQWDAAVEEFVIAYPAAVERARASLAGMFSEFDYPPADIIATQFGLAVRYQPVPDAADFRLAIPDHELRALQSEAQASVEAAMRAAQASIRDRLVECLHNLHERLTSPTGFRGSSLDHARELAALVPRLLIEPDARIEAIAKELDTIASSDPTWIRISNPARQKAADQTARLLAQMQDFVGVA